MQQSTTEIEMSYALRFHLLHYDTVQWVLHWISAYNELQPHQNQYKSSGTDLPLLHPSGFLHLKSNLSNTFYFSEQLMPQDSNNLQYDLKLSTEFLHIYTYTARQTPAKSSLFSQLESSIYWHIYASWGIPKNELQKACMTNIQQSLT